MTTGRSGVCIAAPGCRAVGEGSEQQPDKQRADDGILENGRRGVGGEQDGPGMGTFRSEPVELVPGKTTPTGRITDYTATPTLRAAESTNATTRYRLIKRSGLMK